MFTDEQVMLCLAGISYRGFFQAGSHGPLAGDVLQAPIERGLNTLAPLRDGWDLVWGPAHYRGPLSLFDEKLMYVVQDRRRSNRYVVVLRGTNPISATDWLFGDLWTGRQTPWLYGDGTARVSFSAALGLAIVKGLRSPGPRRSATSRLWANVDQHIADLRIAARAASRPLRRLGERALEPLGRQLMIWLQQLSRVRHIGLLPSSDAAVSAYLSLWRSDVRERVFDVLDRIGRIQGDQIERWLLSFIENEQRYRSSREAGSDLLTFLAAAIENATGPLDIVVAGHSKAGALASTVALWLAETQGDRTPAEERWDPGRRATVHCWSYAGPTAGDAAFARRSDALLGARCHRVWNDLDIVPRAWCIDDLVSVPALYEPAIGRLPLVGDLVDTIVHKVKPLAYTQLGGDVHRICGKVDPAKPYFFVQLAHQHFDAYLSELDLTRHGVTQAVLFDQTTE